MANSKRHQVMDAVIAALEGVTIANGYVQELKRVTETFEQYDQIDHQFLPQAMPIDADEKRDPAVVISATNNDLEAELQIIVSLVVFDRYNKTRQQRTDLMRDVEKALLNDTTLAGELPWLSARGIGVINASPLSMALLSDRGPPDWHPAPAELKARCAEAAAHCRARGRNIMQLAVQWSCAHPLIASTLVGTADPANIEQNVACLDQPLDQELLAEVLLILAPVQNRTWPSGLTDNNDLST